MNAVLNKEDESRTEIVCMFRGGWSIPDRKIVNEKRRE